VGLLGKPGDQLLGPLESLGVVAVAERWPYCAVVVVTSIVPRLRGRDMEQRRGRGLRDEGRGHGGGGV
jgi:hypothetical protein